MKTAREKNLELFGKLSRLTDKITVDDCNTLRRAAMILARWGCLECGDCNNFASWAIERDEQTDIPYLVTHPYHSNKILKRRFPDREKGALARIDKICKRVGLFFYYQTDPRGWPLYVDKEPLLDDNYNRGVGIAA